MNQKSDIWKKITVLTFFLVLTGFGIAAVFLPDVTVSKTERRTLAQKPKLSIETVQNGSYMEKLETYFLEQFAGREFFRTLKAETETTVFGKTDSNGYYQIGDSVYKLDEQLNEKNIVHAAEAFSRVKSELLPEAEAYYAVIPDKNYFVAEENGYPSYDYGRLQELMQNEMKDISYIDIYHLLELEDYYRTDLHWKQECIVDVAEELLSQMSEKIQVSADKAAYTRQTAVSDFSGGYAGASAFAVEPEEMQYLTNDTLERAIVYDYETKQETTIYQKDKLEGMDAYDFYLGGARALITIQNPDNQNGKKLLVFRDSFGSSIAPLFLEKYEEITLVDFRYISEKTLPEVLDTAGYDNVLFLYSTTVLNHSDSMKIN